MYLGDCTTWAVQILAVEKFFLLSHVVSDDLQDDYEAAYHDFLRASFIPEEGQILPHAYADDVGQLAD